MGNQETIAALRRWGGGFIFLLYSFAAVSKWGHTGKIFFVLLALRDFLLAGLILVRKPALRRSNFRFELFSYASMAIPLFYFGPVGRASALSKVVIDTIFITGFLLSSLATIDIGDRFGVSPAARGDKVTTGIYKYLKHPMYTGYAISEFGCVLMNPVNIFIYTLSMACYFLRAKKEDSLFKNYNKKN